MNSLTFWRVLRGHTKPLLRNGNENWTWSNWIWSQVNYFELICVVCTLRSVCETSRKLLTENDVRNCRVFTVHHWYATLVIATSLVVKATTSRTSGCDFVVMAPVTNENYIAVLTRHIKMSQVEKMSLNASGFQTRSDTNRPVQSKKQVRSLKF